MNRYLLLAFFALTAGSCGAPPESPAKSPAQRAEQSAPPPAAQSSTPSWSGCPVTQEEVAAATGMSAGKAHFRESDPPQPARCSYTVGSSGIAELYDIPGLTSSNYLTETARALLPDNAKLQWHDAPDLGASARTACGVFKDALLLSCVAVALHDSGATVVMVSTGESKTDAERTAAAIALAKKTVRP